MITEIFRKEKNIFWMVHFPPLMWCVGYPWQKEVLEKAISDATTLVEGWIDAIIMENNYDIPHTRNLSPEVTSQMTFLALELRKSVSIPIGICCLWNDWKSALAIAKIASLDFIRIPVFVDKIQTSYWFVIEEDPKEIIVYKNKIGAENIKIITDIHVKHSMILNQDSLLESAKKAIEQGSDGLIITGNWTGDLPKLDDLQEVRDGVWTFPIIVGSGVDSKNITQILDIADAMIVGTALKTSQYAEDDINMRDWREKIDKSKVQTIMETILTKR